MPSPRNDSEWIDSSVHGVLINLLILPELYRRLKKWWKRRQSNGQAQDSDAQ